MSVVPEHGLECDVLVAGGARGPDLMRFEFLWEEVK
jgi:hypothetical protein